MFFILVLFLLPYCRLQCYGTKLNNACNNFPDYSRSRVSKNCFYNPDNLLETPQLIEKYTGKLETFKVYTDDGYILTMFRIPRKNPKGVILLQHGNTVNSRCWVAQGNSSFAFYLWRSGYDIWLNNMRGTLFSEKHKNLTISDFEFWNFGPEEVGYYDVPSQIKLIKKITKQSKIVYIGHSLGTTAGLIYSSLLPEEAKNSIKSFIFMATACYYNFTDSPVNVFRLMEPLISGIVNSLKIGNVMMNFPLLPVSRLFLRAFPISLTVINMFFSFFTGWTPEEMNPVVLNYDIVILLKGFSWKGVLHLLQLSAAKTRFQRYDYGKRENLKIYKSEEPPAYPIEKISVPILFVSSKNDTLTTLKDSDLLLERLSTKSEIHGHLKIADLNHVDYVLGKNLEQIYFRKVLDYINNLYK